jgi:hypothetical protein
VGRESSLEERERKDQEKADAIKERQIRLGHIPAPEEVEEEKESVKAEEPVKVEKEESSDKKST